MSDIQFLFVILGALYLWECACWLRRGGIACSTWLGRVWRVQHPAVMLGNQKGGFIVAPPFPPLGSTLIAFQPPFSLGLDGVLWFVASNVNPGWRAHQSARFLDWNSLADLKLRGKKLRLKDEILFSAPTTTRASFLFQTLTQIAKLSPDKRPDAIHKFVHAALDEKAVAARWATFQAETKILRLLTNALFVLVFILAPALIGFIGLKLVWLWLSVALVTLMVSTAVLFARVHRKFWPEADDDRFTHSLIIALAPATTMRALDIASRPLLENFHPLAVAKHFLPPAAFQRFARRVLLDMRHPVLPTCPNPQREAIATEAFIRRTLVEAVEAWLTGNKIAPAELCKPPAPADESCQAYCPRCEAQFTPVTGACADCGGLPLLALPKAS
jgi:hypothetical protein